MTLGRTGLLLPAAVASVVALAATALPAIAPPSLLAVALVAAVGSIVAARRPGRGTTRVAATAAAVGLVLSAVTIAEPQRHPPAVPIGRPVAADVRVEAVQTFAAQAHAGALTTRSLLRGTLVGTGRTTGLAVPIVLFGDRLGRPVPGSVVRAEVVLRRADAVDQAAFTGSALGRVAVRHAAPWPQAVAAALRARFVAATARLPGDGGALLAGLAIGDTSRVDESLTRAMRDASLTHLTAVSGANCAVVIVAVLGVAGVLRLPRPVRLLTAGAALAGFVVLVTPQPSVARAAVMAALTLACLLSGRRTTGPPVLALAVLALLVLDPWYAWSAGFVLSVAATAGLLLLAPPIADRLGRVLPGRLALLLAVPIAAQLACQPVLVLLQPGIPLFGVLANLLAEPAAPVVTVLGLLACLLGAVAPPLGAGLALLAWIPAAWIGMIARTVGGLPQVDWPAGVAGAAVAGVVTAVAAALLLGTRLPRVVRALAAAVAGIALLAALGSAAGGALGRSTGTPSDWVLAACDVGQGDGLVLDAGGGRYAVVDTGPEPGPMLDCLDRLGVRRVDLLVLTHWDADHVGGARAVLPRVRSALVGPEDGPESALLRRDIARVARVHQARRGDEIRIGDLRLRVLWPPDPLGAVQPGNDASITLLVEGDVRVLLTGDLGEQSEDGILAAGPLPAVDVVKVAHHGSADQSPAFYAATHARLGVISVGADNDYGHPSRRLLQILRSTGVQPVRTDEDGLVLVARRGGRVVVWTERPLTASVWAPAK